MPRYDPEPITVEAIYGDFLERSARGESPSFAALVETYPDFAETLRVVHTLCQRSAGVVPPAATLPSFRDEAARRVTDFGDSELARILGRPGREEPGSTFGRYHVNEEVARGGMGAIFRVDDRDLGRELAMKVMLGTVEDRRGFVRFVEEAKITAQLDHPSVVPVHDLGFDPEGRVFFTMRLVRGRNLGEVIRMARDGSAEWRLSRVVGAILRAAQAVAAAHARGVIHRDLKPLNIMVGDYGEVYVMDWGLAKVIDADTAVPEAVKTMRSSVKGDGRDSPFAPLVTADGAVVGTPAYMPPEQAAGRLDEVDRSSDVYSLGAILYELLTGSPPYVTRGESVAPAEVLARVIAGPPPRIESGPPQLVAVCEKAMAREKGDRYATSGELVADLQAFREDRVVRAYATGAAAELRSWVRRNRLVAGTAGVAALLLLGSLSIFLVLQGRAIEQVDAANSRLEAANTTLERTNERVLRLADIKRIGDRVFEADDDLWPCVPEKVDAMRSWIEAAEALLARRRLHEETLSRLRERALPYTPEERERDRRTSPSADRLEEKRYLLEQLEAEKARKAAADPELAREYDEAMERVRADIVELEWEVSRRRTWTLPTEEENWEHETLGEVIRRLDILAARLADVRGRVEFAASVRKKTIDDHREAWDEAIRGIADVAKSPLYGGLRIREQVGLVPLGQDPQSTLWEFAHLQTGRVPERDPETGRLALEEGVGIVFVLIPGGTFVMGRVTPDGTRPPGTPNVDPDATDVEGPLHEVTLAPFFLSKYEMTAGQWERFTGENASHYAGRTIGGRKIGPLHPVEQVSWERCSDVLDRLGLALPTEAQWEYAARAGTTTAWWTGNDRESLRGKVNIADQAARRIKAGWAEIDDWPDLDDGHGVHAPIGTYPPNPWGLHEISGNVWEWCRDIFGSYRNDTVRPGDGLRAARKRPSESRVYRGGGFNTSARYASVAFRDSGAPSMAVDPLGVRPSRPLEN